MKKGLEWEGLGSDGVRSGVAFWGRKGWGREWGVAGLGSGKII